MLEPGVRIVGIQAVEIVGDMLALRLVLDDGGTAATWWPLDEMPRFLTRIGVDTSPRPTGAPLQ